MLVLLGAHQQRAFQSAARHGYSNGQCKSITMELISAVRMYGICNRHSSQLNTYFVPIYIYTKSASTVLGVSQQFPTRGRDEGAVEVVTRMKVPLTPPTTEDEAEEGGMAVGQKCIIRRMKVCCRYYVV